MFQTTALGALVLAAAGCAASPPPKPALPVDTKHDLECVLGRLAEEKKFDDVEAACLPGQEKRLVIILALLEADRSLLHDNAIAAVQSSLDLHEMQRRGFSRLQEKK